MGANAATKCLRVVYNVEKVLAIELMSAAQAIEFKRPSATSPFLEQFLIDFRRTVSFAVEDRVFYHDITKAIDFITSYDM
jgi:histidine ammonia-lyase